MCILTLNSSTDLRAFLSVSIQATTILGFLLSSPLRSSSWTTSAFSISIYIRQMSVPSSLARALGWLNTLATTPDTTSPVVLQKRQHIQSLSKDTGPTYRMLPTKSEYWRLTPVLCWTQPISGPFTVQAAYYLLDSYVGILNKGQGCLQAFKLSHCVGVSDKLLYQSEVLSPLWTLLISNPLE